MLSYRDEQSNHDVYHFSLFQESSVGVDARKNGLIFGFIKAQLFGKSAQTQKC